MGYRGVSFSKEQHETEMISRTEESPMDFSLNDKQRAWQDKARRFAAEEIRPISLERDAVPDPFETWDWEVIRKGSKLGFRTAVVAEAEGGHGIDFVTQALVMAELARADSAISKAFSQCWKWSHLIARVCNDDQKERFLEPFLADDTYVIGFGATEPTSGSDNRMPPADDIRAGVRLNGVIDGDEMVLNGSKLFIANGSVGKLFFLFVRTDPGVHVTQGTTMVMIERGTPGFRHGKVFNKSGWRFYQNAELIFEDARIPLSNVVGEINGALRRGEGEIGGDIFGDLELAANGLGICDDACDTAIELVRSRTQGGRPLKDQQLVQLKVGRMKMLTEALRSYVMRVAWEHDRRIHSNNAGLAMNLATDTIQEVADHAMDVFDGAGSPMDRHAEKLARDTFIWSHLAGDSVQRLKIVRRMLH
jgi:alkylation response protein AidB-like acyl-CoA dehydrogenase